MMGCAGTREATTDWLRVCTRLVLGNNKRGLVVPWTRPGIQELSRIRDFRPEAPRFFSTRAQHNSEEC
jgi:hypothetical protein